jgi:hypothetical protein
MLWQCKACGHQTSLTSGTALHRTRLPLTLWFWAVYLVTTHTPGLSAVQLRRQLGLSYETAWALLHKLRRAMVRPDREALKGKVEVDETYLGGPEAGLKGGRQPLDKALIGAPMLVMVNVPPEPLDPLLPSRARAATGASSRAISSTGWPCASRSTGTMSPQSVATTTPRW